MADEKKILIDVEIKAGQAIQELAKTRKEIDDLKAKQKELDKSTEEGRLKYEAYGVQIRSLNEYAKKYQKEIDNNIKSQKAQSGSLEQLKSDLSNLTASYNSLSKEQRKSAEGIQLKNQIKGISDELKAAEGGIGKFNRSVGDYSNQIKAALAGGNPFLAQIFEMSSGASVAGESFGKNAVGGIKAFSAQLLKLLAHPIVLIIAAIIVVVKQLADAFKANDTAGTKLEATLAKLSPVINIIKKGFELLAEVIADVVEAVGDAVTYMIGLVSKSASDATKAASDSVKELDALEDKKRSLMQKSVKDEAEIARLRNEAAKTDDPTKKLPLLQKAADLEKALLDKKRKYADDDLTAQINKIAVEKSLSEESKQALIQATNDLDKLTPKQLKIWNRLSDDIKTNLISVSNARIEAQKEFDQGTRRLNSSITTEQESLNREIQQKAKEAYEKRKAIAENIAKAEIEIENIKSQSIIDIQKSLIENEKTNYTERINAVLKSESEQIAIINRNKNNELKQSGLTAKEKELIIKRADSQIVKIKSETEKTITDIEAKELDKRLKKEADSLEAKKQQLANKQAADLEDLSKEYANSLKKAKYASDVVAIQEKYEKDKLAIAQKYREQDFNESIAAMQAQLDLLPADADARIEIEKAIADAKSKYAQESVDIAIKANEDIAKNHEETVKKQIDLEQQLKDKKQELYAQLQTTIQDIANGAFERKNQELDEETARITSEYDKQIAAAEGNEKKQKDIESKKAARLEEQEAQKRKLIREQAIVERAFQTFSIGVDTTRSVGEIQLNAAILASNPITAALAPLALAQIPVAIGIGALQLASIMAAPLPKAQYGKVFKGPSHAQGGIPVEVEGDEIIMTKGVYRNPMLRELASMINQAGGGISFSNSNQSAVFASGGFAGRAIFSDGGYAARRTSENYLSKDDMKEAMMEAVKEIVVIATIEDIRKSDKNYMDIVDNANY